jgi:hypothetical protein
MNTPERQIEELREAERDLLKRLETLRAKHHEAGARANDQLTQLQVGMRRP